MCSSGFKTFSQLFCADFPRLPERSCAFAASGLRGWKNFAAYGFSDVRHYLNNVRHCLKDIRHCFYDFAPRKIRGRTAFLRDASEFKLDASEFKFHGPEFFTRCLVVFSVTIHGFST